MNVSSTSDYLAKWCYCNYWCMLHFTIEVFIYIHWYWELDDKKTFYSMEYIRLPSTTKITTFEFSCCMGAKVYFIGVFLTRWNGFTLHRSIYLSWYLEPKWGKLHGCMYFMCILRVFLNTNVVIPWRKKEMLNQPPHVFNFLVDGRKWNVFGKPSSLQFWQTLSKKVGHISQQSCILFLWSHL